VLPTCQNIDAFLPSADEDDAIGTSITIVGHGNMSNEPNRVRLADGCRHVFLDLGGNLGIQARKLFEPDKYPKRKKHIRPCYSIIDEFDNYFGDKHIRRKDVCVIGFEPNPSHFARLRELAERYTLLGYRTTYIFAAVGPRYTTAKFTTNQENVAEDGGHLKLDGAIDFDLGLNASNVSHLEVTVPVVGFPEFLRKHIAGRRTYSFDSKDSPAVHSKPPVVVAKMDVEGAEYGILRSLMRSNEARLIDMYLIEWHNYNISRGLRLRAEWSKAAVNMHDLKFASILAIPDAHLYNCRRLHAQWTTSPTDSTLMCYQGGWVDLKTIPGQLIISKTTAHFGERRKRIK